MGDLAFWRSGGFGSNWIGIMGNWRQQWAGPGVTSGLGMASCSSIPKPPLGIYPPGEDGENFGQIFAIACDFAMAKIDSSKHHHPQPLLSF